MADLAFSTDAGTRRQEHRRRIPIPLNSADRPRRSNLGISSLGIGSYPGYVSTEIAFGTTSRAVPYTPDLYYRNNDPKVPYSRNQLHAVRVWPECGRLTAGPFLLGVRPDRTPSKNGPESQGPREGQMRTACSASTVPGAGSIAGSND